MGFLIDTIPKSLFETLRTGEYFLPMPVFGSDAIALAADRIYAHPFIVARALTIDRLGIEVTAGDSGKIARLGIYKNGTNLYPGELVKDYGTVDVSSIAVVAASGDQSLTKGLYWLVVVSDGTPTLRWQRPAWSPLGHYEVGWGTGNCTAYWRKDGVGIGALADPFVSDGEVYYTYFPAVMPRLKSLD